MLATERPWGSPAVAPNRQIDHGPFAAGRVLDLSCTAMSNEAAPNAGFCLKVGASRQPEGAAQLRERVLRAADDGLPNALKRA
jgi:hypothetical protein